MPTMLRRGVLDLSGVALQQLIVAVVAGDQDASPSQVDIALRQACGAQPHLHSLEQQGPHAHRLTGPRVDALQLGVGPKAAARTVDLPNLLFDDPAGMGAREPGSVSFSTTLVPSARQLADAGLRVPVRSITQRSSGPTRDHRCFRRRLGGRVHCVQPAPVPGPALIL